MVAVHDEETADGASSATEDSTVVLQLPATNKVAAVALVLVTNLATFGLYVGYLVRSSPDWQRWNTLITLFNLDGEMNLATVVSVIGLAWCAVLLALLAAVRGRQGYG